MSTLEAASAPPATTASERVCYVHCTFCNTVLAVSVPCSSMYTIVTVRCGHCSNLLSVNMGAAPHQTLPPSPPHPLPPPHHYLPHQDFQQKQQQQEQNYGGGDGMMRESGASTSKYNRFTAYDPPEPHLQPPTRMPPIPPPEKRQRIPSAYNRFIKEEIQRIKATNPEISHREAFSTAAKNWAHFPHIHFGLNLEGNKRAKTMDEDPANPKPRGFY